MGALLTEVRDLQLAEELKSREDALRWVRVRLGSNAERGTQGAEPGGGLEA